MKKILLLVVSIVLASITIFAGCTDENEPVKPDEINQWDYFDQFLNYTQYEYLDERPADSARNTIVNSYGETQQNCWNFVGNFGDVNIKTMASQSDFDYYFKLRLSRLTNAKAITMTALSFKLYADADCMMKFSLTITGDTTPRASITVNATANTGTELSFADFAEYTWAEGSKSTITITLENPAEIGNIKYGFSDFTLSLRSDE